MNGSKHCLNHQNLSNKQQLRDTVKVPPPFPNTVFRGIKIANFLLSFHNIIQNCCGNSS